MPSRYQFTEENGFGESSGSMSKGGNSGCHVSVVAGFVLTLLAVILAVGVGLVVHFVERDNYDRDITCNFPTDSMAALLEQLQKGQDTTTPAVVTTTPSTTPEVDDIDYRLPSNLLPRHYDLELAADIYGPDPADFSLWGNVVITMDCETPTKVITLHAKNLSVPAGGVSVFKMMGGANAGAEPVEVVGVTLEKKPEFLHVEVKEELQKGAKYTLKAAFSGPLTDDLAGLYLSSYKRGNQTVYLATTQFEVGDARAAFPCFDEPAMKATFNVTLLRKLPLVSLSNTEIISTTTRPDGWTADVYDITPIMPTYLLAFIVCDFVHLTDTSAKGIKFGVWARRELQDSMEYALRTGSIILDYYGDVFGTNFPLKKQDMVAIPDFAAGAMENWGLITYREAALLYKEGDSENQRQYVTLVIAHELAHQWFGNLVTMLWWDDLWLNEGFAEFVEYIGMDKVAPEWKVWEQFALTVVQKVFKDDQIVASHPLYSPAKTVDLIWQYFDNISYSKGASVIRMLEFILGQGTFRRGLQRYLRVHQYGNADHNDLWEAFAEQARNESKVMDIPAIMNTWTVQMGFPVVKVTRHFSGDVTFTQKRFLINSEAKDPGVFTSPYGYRWDIPLTLATSKQPNFDVTSDDVKWLTRNSASVTLTPWTAMPTHEDKDSWMLANVHQYGFYRVNYDPSNWKALVNQLNKDHKVIPPINRAQIIDDAWNLANAGETTIDIAMSTLEYIGKEEDYVPWGAAYNFLGDLKTRMHGTSGYGALTRFIQDRIRPIFTKLGLDDTNATSLQSYTRSLVIGLACGSGLPECVRGVVNLFKQWKDNPDINPISPTARRQVYCIAVNEGDESDWLFVLNRYRQEKSPAERPLLMAALACSSKTWLLSTLLDMAVATEDIKRDDATSVIGQVASNSVGTALAWDFIREHWDLIQRDFSQSSSRMGFMIDSIISGFRTDFSLNKFAAFVSEKSIPGAKKVYLEQGMETVRFNVRWHKNYFQQIVQWLDAQGFGEFKGTGTDTSVVTAENVRLPTDLKPVHYDVTIEPNMYGPDPKAFTFNGTMTFTFACVTSTDKIVLHINELEVSNIVVSPASSGQTSSPQYASHSEDKILQFLVIMLSGPLTAGLNYSVSMDFTGPLDNKALDGLYLSSYQNATGTVYLAVTQFEPTDARKAFPCMDEPAQKATFTITLVRRTFNKAISNMPLQVSTPLGGDRVADQFQKSVPMSTYLVALVVCDFHVRTKQTSKNVTFEVWARPEYAEQVNFALDFGVKAMDFLEDYFDVPFPLPKQSMIAIPDFAAGAMENWGLITYRETRVLYQPGVSSIGNKESAAMTIAHELAHMWFGDLVTMVWWDELWLNEGFARFMQFLGVDHVYPEWREFELFVRVVHSAMAKDGLVSSHPVYVPVATPAQINEIFDSISYDKGASIIRMIRHAIGEDTFKRALTNYLNQLKYQNAARTDLWNALNDQAQKEGRTINVGEVMDTWTVQMNYPVVKVTKQGQSLTISQERFLQDPTAKDPGKYKSPFGYMWDIPFTYTTGSNPSFDAPRDGIKWLKRDQYNTTFNDPSLQTNSWVLGNVKELGYYRVNYDDDNWGKLTAQLSTNFTVIHPVNRAQIINDAWNLASGGYLSMAIALSTVDYLHQEVDFIPWNAAIGELGYVNTILSSTEIYGAYQMFMRNKTSQLYSQLGMNNTGASLRESFLRGLMSAIACGAEEENCVQDALALFSQWKQNPANNPIAPELRSVVYCTALRHGGSDEWNFLYGRFKVEANINEKERMMQRLACSNQLWILRRLLNRALYSDDIRSQDALRVMYSVMANPAGTSLAWSFIRTSWDDIFDRYRKSPFALKNLMGGLGRVFNTRIQLQELKDFQEAHPDMGSATRAFEAALESTNNNIRWMEKNYDIINSWLKTKGYQA